MSLLSSIYSLFAYITPVRLQVRLHALLSVGRQIRNLVIGRLLPDLKKHIPNTDLTDRTAIVTGANSGIGLQIALELATRGANVVLACRSPSRGESALQQVLSNVPAAKGRVSVLQLDTSSLESVREFAGRWAALQSSLSDSGDRKLDILVHNAGISHAPSGQDFTDEGLEILYATNFLGSFLLTHLLEPHLNIDARVVLTSSTGQLSARFKEDFSHGPVKGACELGFHVANARHEASDKYGMTKAMQCAFAKSLQRRWDRASLSGEQKDNGENSALAGNKKKTAHSFSPGFTMTPIFGKFEANRRDPAFQLLKWGTAFATKVDQGAATGSWLACTRDIEVVNGGGGYWDRMNREFSVADKMSDEMLTRLWKRWERDAGVEWTAECESS